MIALQISTITKEKNEPPQTAYKIDCGEEFNYEEISQFYFYLKYCVKHIENIIYEELNENE